MCQPIQVLPFPRFFARSPEPEVEDRMRRLVSLAVLLFFAIPFGISLSGCSKGTSVIYCNGENAGLVVGQLQSLDLEPRLTGVSLNQGEIGNLNSPTGKDCKSTSVTPTNVIYSSTNMSLVDVVPATGRLCAGTWNRNTGGSIADYTFCTPGSSSGTAFVTASASGVSSNPLAVYIHPIVASIELVKPTSDCTTPGKQDSSCYSESLAGACLPTSPVAATTQLYDGNECISQNFSAQLAAQSFDSNGNNISCQVGPLTFAPTNGNIVTIDQNGLATAAQPGSTLINTTISQASSSVGFFSTCPPKTIVLSTTGSATAPTAAISVNQNTTQNLVATITDINGNPITNLPLEFVSTSPITIPVAGSAITPTFPGSAAITAICQPTSTSNTGGVNNCNPSAFNQIGYLGNGLPIASNPLQVNAPGTSPATILYIASTQSQYIQPVDFTLTTQPSPLRLPYAPNSIVISEDLSSIYMGTSTELMVLSATINGLTLARQDPSVQGYVLAVSPDNTTVVIADPVRRLTYLYTSGGAIFSQYGGYGTRAQWSPDSQTVYVTVDDSTSSNPAQSRILAYSNNTGWIPVPLGNANNVPATDVAVTIPSVGVYLANGTTLPVSARTDCTITTVTGTGFATTTTNAFYPPADTIETDHGTRIAALNDGVHIVTASPTAFAELTTPAKSGACPIAFTNTNGNNNHTFASAFTGITITPTSTLTGTASTTGSGVVGIVPRPTRPSRSSPTPAPAECSRSSTRPRPRSPTYRSRPPPPGPPSHR